MNDTPKLQSLADLSQEKRIQLLLDAVTDIAIYMLDPDGIIVTWNAGAERLKGYSASEIIGQNYELFFTEQERERGVPRAVLAAAAKNGRFESEGWRVRKDGKKFCVFGVVDAVRAADGTLLGFAKITRDITEKRELNATRDQLAQSQKMEAVGQLTGGIAHDFNNLLTVVLGNLDRIQRRLSRTAPNEPSTELARELSRPLSMAIEGGQKAAQLTHRLLAFSRRQALEPRPIEANKLIFGMFDLIRHTLGETIDVRFEASADRAPIFVDANQLESVLLNLAVNSRDAMPDGGRLTIATASVYVDPSLMPELEELEEGQYVIIAVSDTGEGISEKHMDRIFEPFFTTKETGKGSGLGLAMVHGFVKQSGGHVRVSSEPGHGTTIELYLPRDIAARPEPKGRPPQPVSAASDSHAVRRRGTVLLVEDNEAVRSLARACLEEMGFGVAEASDGPSAMQVLKKLKSVGFLFTDVVLPGGMTGRDVAHSFMESNPGIPVLFTSGYVDKTIGMDAGLEAGTHFLRKPYTHDQLVKKIDELFNPLP
jgi:PAS domain S-box-containing protein